MDADELRTAERFAHGVREAVTSVDLGVETVLTMVLAIVRALTQGAVRRNRQSKRVLRLHIRTERTDRVDDAAVASRKPDREPQCCHGIRGAVDADDNVAGTVSPRLPLRPGHRPDSRQLPNSTCHDRWSRLLLLLAEYDLRLLAYSLSVRRRGHRVPRSKVSPRQDRGLSGPSVSAPS